MTVSNTTDTNQASEDGLRYEPRHLGKSFKAWQQFIHLSRTGKSIAYRTPEGDICSPAYVKELIRTEKLKLLAEVKNEWKKFGKDTNMSDGEYAFLDIITKLEAEL